MLWSLFPSESVQDRVLRNTPATHGAFTADIAAGAGLPTKAVRRVLKRLRDKGRVSGEQRGAMVLWQRTGR